MRKEPSELALALGIFALLILASAGLGFRFGYWRLETGFALVKVSGWIGGVALLLGLASSILKKASHDMPRWEVVTALMLGVICVGFPLRFAELERVAPPIHDITTDPEHPPELVALLGMRQDSPNPPAYGGRSIAEQQKAAYPDIKPEVLALPMTAAFARAVHEVKELGWELVATDPDSGRIEATATSLWWGLKDDIVIRLTPVPGGTQVDVRSISRSQANDLGSDAKRVRGFLGRISS